MSELEHILDDALADFDTEDVKAATETDDTNKASTVHTPLPDFNDFIQVTEDDEEKYIEDLTKEFDKAFSDLLDSTPDLKTTLDHFDKDQTGQNSSDDMEGNITRTMEKLFRDAASASEGGAAHGEAEGGAEGMVPVLENLLSKLLSKEILHEPLQELLNLYPEWLDNNNEDPKFAVYEKQCQIVQNICDIFNGDNYQNEASTIYTLLNDMQETGPPPADIVNKMSQDIPEAMRGPPPGSVQDQCSVM